MSRMNVKEYMMSLLPPPAPDPLEKWMEATAFIPEWHEVLAEEWHSRNFSQDEADTVNGVPQGFLKADLPSAQRKLEEMAVEIVGVPDED